MLPWEYKKHHEADNNIQESWKKLNSRCKLQLSSIWTLHAETSLLLASFSSYIQHSVNGSFVFYLTTKSEPQTCLVKVCWYSLLCEYCILLPSVTLDLLRLVFYTVQEMPDIINKHFEHHIGIVQYLRETWCVHFQSRRIASDNNWHSSCHEPQISHGVCLYGGCTVLCL